MHIADPASDLSRKTPNDPTATTEICRANERNALKKLLDEEIKRAERDIEGFAGPRVKRLLQELLGGDLSQLDGGSAMRSAATARERAREAIEAVHHHYHDYPVKRAGEDGPVFTKAAEKQCAADLTPLLLAYRKHGRSPIYEALLRRALYVRVEFQSVWLGREFGLTFENELRELRQKTIERLENDRKACGEYLSGWNANHPKADVAGWVYTTGELIARAMRSRVAERLRKEAATGKARTQAGARSRRGAAGDMETGDGRTDSADDIGLASITVSGPGTDADGWHYSEGEAEPVSVMSVADATGGEGFPHAQSPLGVLSPIRINQLLGRLESLADEMQGKTLVVSVRRGGEVHTKEVTLGADHQRYWRHYLALHQGTSTERGDNIDISVTELAHRLGVKESTLERRISECLAFLLAHAPRAEIFALLLRERGNWSRQKTKTFVQHMDEQVRNDPSLFRSAVHQWVAKVMHAG